LHISNSRYVGHENANGLKSNSDSNECQPCRGISGQELQSFLRRKHKRSQSRFSWVLNRCNWSAGLTIFGKQFTLLALCWLVSARGRSRVCPTRGNGR